jgi:hypothetical protein
MGSDAQPSPDWLLREYIANAPVDVRMAFAEMVQEFNHTQGLLARERVIRATAEQNYSMLSRTHARELDEWTNTRKQLEGRVKDIEALAWMLYSYLHDGPVNTLAIPEDYQALMRTVISEATRSARMKSKKR